jgi:hypothetical protein
MLPEQIPMRRIVRRFVRRLPMPVDESRRGAPELSQNLTIPRLDLE